MAEVQLTITTHGNTFWGQKINSISNWQPWQWTEEQLEFFTCHQQEPPQIELGSFLYQPGWSENLRFYIIVKRTLKKDKKRNVKDFFF